MPKPSTSELFVTDLDGTLLRSDLSISSFTRETLNALIAQGLNFTFATSRSPEKALALLQGIDLSLPGICLNGAICIDVRTGEVLASTHLPAQFAASVMQTAAAAGCTPFVLGRQAGRDVLLYSDPHNDAQRRFLAQRRDDPRLRRAESVSPLPLTLCITLVDRYDALARLHEHLSREAGDQVEFKLMRDIYSDSDGSLEVLARGVDKVARLRELCERMRVSPGDLTVFGDHVNDLGMFAFAGISVAVDNAQPEVKAQATQTTQSNEQDGVARYLRGRFGLA